MLVLVGVKVITVWVSVPDSDGDGRISQLNLWHQANCSHLLSTVYGNSMRKRPRVGFQMPQRRPPKNTQWIGRLHQWSSIYVLIGQSCCSQRRILNIQRVHVCIHVCVFSATHLFGYAKGYNLREVFYNPTWSTGKREPRSEMQIRNIRRVPAGKGINSRTRCPSSPRHQFTEEQNSY